MTPAMMLIGILVGMVVLFVGAGIVIERINKEIFDDEPDDELRWLL